MQYVIVQTSDGARLCQDGLIRTFANFGTFPECVHIYRQQGRAQRRADKLNRGQPNRFRVVSLLDDIVFDAAGEVYLETDGNSTRLGHIASFQV